MTNKENPILKYVETVKLYQTLLLMKYMTSNDDKDKDAAVIELTKINIDLVEMMKFIGESLND